MPSSGLLRHVVLVRTDGAEERSASIIRMARIGELGTTLAVTSVRLLLVTANVVPSSPDSCHHDDGAQLRFLQQSHGVTFQKTEFFKTFCVFFA
jgi:hypothetical protein